MKNIDKYNLIWTAICFSFIAILCLIFKNANVLWLLIIWLSGWAFRED